MITSFIFDLDGTLVQTEKLKAISYARAAIEIAPGKLNQAQVMETFKNVVGLSRQEVAEKLISLLNIREEAKNFITQYSTEKPWQVFWN